MIGFMHETDLARLAQQIKQWGRELGFAGVGIADGDLSAAETGLLAWLDQGFHGEMDYMAAHGTKRSRPDELVPGTIRIISARLDYFPPMAADPHAVMADADAAYLSRYALGRDYHKVLRNRLQRLAEKISAAVGEHHFRVFTDSAPVLEVALAEKCGLGWRGKHTLLLNRQHGSWFFLGEIYTDLPLPPDAPEADHCGTCQACIDVCPTQAIIAPYLLDARRCISYLTIELKGSIPLELRPLLGNRIYGCDDCQWCARGTALRRPPHWRISKSETGSTMRGCWNCLPGAKPISTNGWRARRSAASAMSAGCVISQSRWATRRPRLPFRPRSMHT